jgi:uncharacterized membrane protein YuzA (DUF378 family)
MAFEHTLNKISPRKLFLIDSLGALVSAIMLGAVLTQFEETFGVPQRILYLLAGIAGLFSIYSFVCFLSNGTNCKPRLKIIAIANLLYCMLTAGLIFSMYDKITGMALIYFLGEISIIISLAVIELKVAARSGTIAF